MAVSTTLSEYRETVHACFLICLWNAGINHYSGVMHTQVLKSALVGQMYVLLSSKLQKGQRTTVNMQLSLRQLR